MTNTRLLYNITYLCVEQNDRIVDIQLNLNSSDSRNLFIFGVYLINAINITLYMNI
jgi:hypothetical protein